MGLARGLRRVAVALAIGLVPAAGVQAEVLRLQPDEALMTAQAAYAGGQFDAANRIARALAAIQPEDPRVWLLLSATETRLGRPEAGIQEGRAGWRAARAADAAPALRYEIARNTAKAAFEAGRPLVAQYWLRRSLDVAPDAAAEDRSGRDLVYVRNRNPWRWNFALEAGPSDNLNGGAEDPVFRIGDFVVGTLGDGAQALSGARVNMRIGVQRLIPGSATGQTVLSFSAEAVRNYIDEASQAKAGSVTARDLDRSQLSVGLRRDMLVGADGRPLSLSVDVARGWAGGSPYSHNVRFAGQYALHQSARGNLWLSASAERSWEGDGDLRVDLVALTLAGEAPLRSGRGSVSLGFTLETARSDDVNSTFDAARMVMLVDPGWTVGPARVSLGMNAGLRNYDAFNLFGSVYVTGGRQDQSFGASVDFTFDDWSVMGFAPVLSLRHGQTDSNVSRYETSTTGISIGISSVF